VRAGPSGRVLRLLGGLLALYLAVPLGAFLIRLARSPNPGFSEAGLYPALLPSSLDARFSRTAFNTQSSPLTLTIMLGVAFVMVPIVILYQAWVYCRFSEPVTVESLEAEDLY